MFEKTPTPTLVSHSGQMPSRVAPALKGQHPLWPAGTVRHPEPPAGSQSPHDTWMHHPLGCFPWI